MSVTAQTVSKIVRTEKYEINRRGSPVLR